MTKDKGINALLLESLLGFVLSWHLDTISAMLNITGLAGGHRWSSNLQFILWNYLSSYLSRPEIQGAYIQSNNFSNRTNGPGQKQNRICLGLAAAAISTCQYISNCLLGPHREPEVLSACVTRKVSFSCVWLEQKISVPWGGDTSVDYARNYNKQITFSESAAKLPMYYNSCDIIWLWDRGGWGSASRHLKVAGFPDSDGMEIDRVDIWAPVSGNKSKKTPARIFKSIHWHNAPTPVIAHSTHSLRQLPSVPRGARNFQDVASEFIEWLSYRCSSHEKIN